MKLRVPSASFALAAHAFLAVILGVLSVRTNNDILLYLLVAPILIAPLVYPRAVALAMLFMTLAGSGIVVQLLRDNPINSVRTIVVLAPGLLAVVEILYRVKGQRDRIDAARREGDRRFRALIEKSSDGIVLFDQRGTVLYSSPAITRMLGYATQEVVGKNILSHVHESDSAALSKQMAVLLQSPGATVSVQLRRQHKEGRWVWVEAMVTNLLFEPSVHAVVVNYRDITERKRSETRLAIFSSLAQKLASATTPVEAGRIILEAAQDLFGWDAGFLHLYSPTTDVMVPILTMDVLEGRKTEISPSLIGRKPTPMLRRVLSEGPQLILRGKEPATEHSLRPIGNTALRSASLMFVPIRDGENAVGILSIQSYAVRAYTPEDLQTLQALANQTAGALARIQEATERQRAEEELRLSETRFRTVVENIGEGLLITDLQDVVLYVNRRMTELCGYVSEEMIGRRSYELIVPAAGWDAIQRKNECRAAGVSERYELVLKRKDGSRFWAEINAAPYRSPDGEIIGTIGAVADITERKQKEEELRRSEERFSKAFRSSPLPLAITSLRDERFLDVNESLTRLLGYSREEIIGRTSQELAIWVDADQHSQIRQALAEQRPLRELTCKVRTKQGEVRDALASAEPFELGGEPCILFISQDITDRLNLEAQLRQAQKMEAVGQLSAGLAHDFNNILTIIQGHITLLSTLRHLDSDAKESMDHIAGASERAANLTAQLLAFSRKRMMQPRQVDLSEVVASAGRMMRGLLGERIELQFAYPGHLPRVTADIGMLEQLIINLALNARDAMPTGGKVVVSLATLEIDPLSARRNPEARPGPFVRMTFEDTGCGMSPETLSRVFEPFFTTKDVGKGSGLGLASVYGIVKQHQGWIEVESRLGSGSTFRIYLPCAADLERQTAPPSSAESVPGGAETILVVEDEPALRELVKKILKLYGYQVLEAANGREALEVWDQHGNQIDLLLTDLVMPEEPTGIELAQRLKAKCPGLKIIYTSGYSIDLKAHSPALHEGLNFLSKPFNPPTLAAAVRRCLDTQES